MSRPQPTREHHDSFCQIEGWRQVRNARGGTGTRHVTYELDLPDGRILRTRISHPVDRSTYGPGIWSHILRDQHQVDEATFWAGVQNDVKPDRGVPELPSEALPADLVFMLISRVGLDEMTVAAMSKDEAIVRLQKYWIDGT
jgi:hypothetical protein